MAASATGAGAAHDVSAVAASPVDKLIALFSRHGDSDYIGEPVSALQHALQAAKCAADAGAAGDLVAGALLHDIGHLIGLDEPDRFSGRMGTCGVAHHESIGAAFVRELGFPHRTVELVRRHVDAKRYLTYKDPEYLAHLSEASKTTLGFQGGPMTAAEAADFEADAMFQIILAMRRWDEAAKDADASVPDLASYRPLLTGLLAARPEEVRG
jgi:phosphonate degradation associated HDIG domain protein